MSGPIVVVGDALLDREVRGEAERLCPEQPAPVLEERATAASPGGAALAAALLARDGREVVLLTALGRDEPGVELTDLLSEIGVAVVDVGLVGATPEKVRLRAGPHLLCRLDRGGGAPRPCPEPLVRRLVADARAVLVSDYGRGLAFDRAVRSAVSEAGTVVWDPHPRGAAPVPGVALATPNEREAKDVVGHGEGADLAERLLRTWDAAGVCVTRGERGAVLARRGAATITIPVEPVDGDPCGAGDRFASASAALLADGVDLPEAIGAACAEAASFVAQGGWHGSATARPAADAEDAIALAARVRAGGGTVVATGGCFDLLHAGHVSMLQAARRLGDCLVVCLNSDRSVRRLKGVDRPLVGEDDRAAVLRSLACVDGVLLFDEDTPVDALRRLRPHVWVKGADYEPSELPEAAVMEELGGRVETVPYVAGRSTSGLIEKALIRAA